MATNQEAMGPESMAALREWARAIDDDKDIREYKGERYMSYVREQLCLRWPNENDSNQAEARSGIRCLLVVMRQMNYALDVDEIDDEIRLKEEAMRDDMGNHIIQMAWRARPLTDPMRIKAVLNILRDCVGGGDIGYSNIEASDFMESAFWSRSSFRLFYIARSDGEHLPYEMVGEQEDPATAARSQVITMDNREHKTVGFDVSGAIEKRCGLARVAGSLDAYTYTFTGIPEYLRVRFTPSDSDVETLESVMGLEVKLPQGGKEELQRQVYFSLIAAVRAKEESSDRFDRVRLFDDSGRDILPEDEAAVYSSMDWDVGAFGHTYFLYYARREQKLSSITRDERQRMVERMREDRCSPTQLQVVIEGQAEAHRLNRAVEAGTEGRAIEDEPLSESAPQGSAKISNRAMPSPDETQATMVREPIRAGDYVPTYRGNSNSPEDEGVCGTLLRLIIGANERQIPREEFRERWVNQLRRLYKTLHKKKKIWIGLETAKFHVLKRIWEQQNTTETFGKLELEAPESIDTDIDVGYYEWLKENQPAFLQSKLRVLPKCRHPEAIHKLEKPLKYWKAGMVDEGPGQTVNECGANLTHRMRRREMEDLAIAWGFELNDVLDPKGFAFEVRVPLVLSQAEQQLLFRGGDTLARANLLIDPRLRLIIDDHDGATYLFLTKNHPDVVLEDVGSYLTSWEDLRAYCRHLAMGNNADLADFLRDRMRLSRLNAVEMHSKARLEVAKAIPKYREHILLAKSVHQEKIRRKCVEGLRTFHAVQDRWHFLTELFIYGDVWMRQVADEQVLSWDEVRYEIAKAWCQYEDDGKRIENGEQAQEWSTLIGHLFHGRVIDTGDESVIAYLWETLKGSHPMLVMDATENYQNLREGIQTTAHA